MGWSSIIPPWDARSGECRSYTHPSWMLGHAARRTANSSQTEPMQPLDEGACDTPIPWARAWLPAYIPNPSHAPAAQASKPYGAKQTDGLQALCSQPTRAGGPLAWTKIRGSLTKGIAGHQGQSPCSVSLRPNIAPSDRGAWTEGRPSQRARGQTLERLSLPRARQARVSGEPSDTIDYLLQPTPVARPIPNLTPRSFLALPALAVVDGGQWVRGVHISSPLWEGGRASRGQVDASRVGGRPCHCPGMLASLPIPPTPLHAQGGRNATM